MINVKIVSSISRLEKRGLEIFIYVDNPSQECSIVEEIRKKLNGVCWYSTKAKEFVCIASPYIIRILHEPKGDVPYGMVTNEPSRA